MAQLSQIISHRFRGFSDHESTITGLLAALDYGVRQIEFDIRLTRCGTPIITHDESARDHAGQIHRVCDVLAADLANLGGDFARMPTARALFAAVAAHGNHDCTLLIDVKDAGFEDMLYALCAEYRLRDRSIWVSWLPEVLFAVHDIDPDARTCLSHWCQSPDSPTRAVHTVYAAKAGEIARPTRRYVHGERSGWFVDGPLRGQLRNIVDWVCIPAGQISADLVADYHRDNIQVSAFSYLTLDAMNAAEQAYGHDAFFSDAKAPFTAAL